MLTFCCHHVDTFLLRREVEDCIRVASSRFSLFCVWGGGHCLAISPQSFYGVCVPDTTLRDLKIIEGTVAGKTCEQIGKEVGCAKSTVHKVQHNPDVKTKIQKIYNKLVGESLDLAASNIAYAIKHYQDRKLQDVKDNQGNVKKVWILDEQLRDHGFKASQKLLESAGLLTSHQVSIVHQTFVNQQNNVVSPVINDLISKYFGGVLRTDQGSITNGRKPLPPPSRDDDSDDDIIDVHPEDLDPEDEDVEDDTEED